MEERRRALLGDATQYPSLSLQPDNFGGRMGEIQGIPVGKQFVNREACYRAGLHTSLRAGISGTVQSGAFSVVLSGAYEDDVDEGETFTYTGTGGRDADDARFGGRVHQTADQSFSHSDNAALKRSIETKHPVRVIRGPNNRSRFAPKEGYRYDGLYTVTDAYLDKGKSGYIVCKFNFVRLKDQLPLPLPLPRV